MDNNNLDDNSITNNIVQEGIDNLVDNEQQPNNQSPFNNIVHGILGGQSQQNGTPIDLQQRVEEEVQNVVQRFELTVGKILIVIASIITTLVVGVFAYNALQPTRHKPSTLMTNPQEHSILKDR